MKIVLASNNRGKLAELQAMLAPLGVELVRQADLGVGEAEEPHCTLVENALAKARHAARACGGAAIADDSGVCVHALDGAPGVISAHYAGDVMAAEATGAAGAPVAIAPGADREAVRYGSRGEYVHRAAPSVRVGIGYRHVGYRGSYGHVRHGYPFSHRHYGYGGYRGHRGYSWGISYGPSFGYHPAYVGYPQVSYDDYFHYRTAPAVVVAPAPQPTVVTAPAPVAQPAPASAPQQVTIINNYYGSPSPMSSANGLFGR